LDAALTAFLSALSFVFISDAEIVVPVVKSEKVTAAMTTALAPRAATSAPIANFLKRVLSLFVIFVTFQSDESSYQLASIHT